jgi:hypothetical protein
LLDLCMPLIEAHDALTAAQINSTSKECKTRTFAAASMRHPELQHPKAREQQLRVGNAME